MAAEKMPRGQFRRGAKMRSKEDVLGSYTGIADDGKPVQDADDL